MAEYGFDEDEKEIIVWVPSSHSDAFRQYLVPIIGETFTHRRNVFGRAPAGPDVPKGQEHKSSMDRFVFPKPDDPQEHEDFRERIQTLIEQFNP